MKQAKFANNQFYHVYNRGVEKRNIFLSSNDYQRFIRGLFEFNDTTLSIRLRQKEKKNKKINDMRDSFVEILCFCLMPNHFHLLLRQLKEGGVSNFMQKLGTGYTMYFNKKYERNGVLFQGVFKSVLIEKENYLIHLFRYIHLNPIELIEPKWKVSGMGDYKKVFNFLKGYSWSSHSDYMGKNIFPLIVQKDFLQEYFGSLENYERFIGDWLVKDLSKIKDLVFD